MPVEEQTQWDSYNQMYSGFRTRLGQRLTISNRIVEKLAFQIYKVGSPTGNVTFTIRKVSDDSVIVSKVWGDASALQIGANRRFEEVTFDTPAQVNEEVRICAEFSGGNSTNTVRVDLKGSDVKPGEYHVYYPAAGPWSSIETNDNTYRYTYSLPAGPGGPPAGLLVAQGII